MKLYAVYRYIQYKITIYIHYIYIIIQRWFDRLPSCSSGQDRVIQMPRCQQRLHLKRLQHLKRLHANMLGTCCMICMMLHGLVWICLDLFGFIGHGGNCLLLCDPVAQHNLRSVLSCRHQRSDRNRTLRHREQISHMYLPLYYIYNGSSWLVLGPPSPQQYLYPL